MHSTHDANQHSSGVAKMEYDNLGVDQRQLLQYGWCDEVMFRAAVQVFVKWVSTVSHTTSLEPSRLNPTNAQCLFAFHICRG